VAVLVLTLHVVVGDDGIERHRSQERRAEAGRRRRRCRPEKVPLIFVVGPLSYTLSPQFITKSGCCWYVWYAIARPLMSPYELSPKDTNRMRRARGWRVVK